MAERKKKSTGILAWIMLGLLIAGLAGFGITGFSGGARPVATVGDQEISMQEYGRALQNEQGTLARQFGRPLTIAEMEAFGLDRLVLDRLVAQAALDQTTQDLNLSAADVDVASQIRNDPSFAGPGGFDREGYTFVLRQAGMREGEYEAQVRRDIARGLLQGAVLGGLQVESSAEELIAAWRYETRDLSFVLVNEADLETPLTAPTDADLQTYFDENNAEFTIPEGRQITVAWISPDALIDVIEVPEDTLRGLYDDRRADYVQPERVWAERLGFLSPEDAQKARDAIEAGETSFDALVEERGLTLDDVDQGQLSAEDVSAPVAEALFALEGPGIAGPVDTSIGSALYRVTALLEATEVPFDVAAPDLRAEYADDQARRQVQNMIADLDDLLAAGATLEELANDTDLTLETVTFRSDETPDGISNYAAFRAAAQAAQEGDFPELLDLSDGGVFALRLDEIIPERLPELSEVRADVAARWSEVQTQEAVEAQAARLAAQLEEGQTWEGIGLSPEKVGNLLRDGFLGSLPGAEVQKAFSVEEGAILTGPAGPGTAYVLSVDKIRAADPEAADVKAATEQFETTRAQSIAQDLFEAYGQAIQDDTTLNIDLAAIAAVRASFTHGGQ